MYKNFIINYVKKLTKEDIYNFRDNNNLNATDNDLNTIYEFIKKYNTVFFDNPEKYVEILKDKVSDNCYKEVMVYYEKYKNYIQKSI